MCQNKDLLSFILLEHCLMERSLSSSPHNLSSVASACLRDVCVKHMEGVRECRAEEAEERKSLVSSTHLSSSSEYSARIGKTIQSGGCSLPPDHTRQRLPLCCHGSQQFPRSPWQLSRQQLQTFKDAHTAIRVNPYLPPPTCKQKYYREKRRERRCEKLSNTHADAYTNMYSSSSAAPLWLLYTINYQLI